MTRKFIFILMIALLAFAGMAQAGGDAAAGEAKAAACADCHGANGEGDDAGTPAIAGLDEAKHVEMLKGFQSGELEGDMMPMMVEGLTEQDMADVAAYYATLGN